jgi:hypothetical protein
MGTWKGLDRCQPPGAHAMQQLRSAKYVDTQDGKQTPDKVCSCHMTYHVTRESEEG